MFSRLRHCIIFSLLKIGKETFEMAMIYAILIVKERKTFKQVPNKLKEQVRAILTDMECEHLIIED